MNRVFRVYGGWNRSKNQPITPSSTPFSLWPKHLGDVAASSIAVTYQDTLRVTVGVLQPETRNDHHSGWKRGEIIYDGAAETKPARSRKNPAHFHP